MPNAPKQPEGDSPTSIVVEEIPNDDTIARLIDFPHKYSALKELIWNCVFEFPQAQGESVAWSKYASIPEEVNNIGCIREREKRPLKQDYRYVGCISASVQEVRCVRNVHGHGFCVIHEPSEGIHHAEIHFLPNSDASQPISRADKVELKAMLRNTFGDLFPHCCDPL